MTSRPNKRSDVYGLLLAGGKSRRMGRDKAALELDGETQLARAFALLARRCGRAFVSIRPEQRHDAARSAFPQLIDRTPDLGPVGGILTALERFPAAAWLVLACDLPLLDGDTLDYLLEHRDTRAIGTAFRSSHDGLPEPLCAIWEAASRDVITAALKRDQRCPRKILLNGEAALLDLPSRHALHNVNTPAELAELERLRTRAAG